MKCVNFSFAIALSVTFASVEAAAQNSIYPARLEVNLSLIQLDHYQEFISAIACSVLLTWRTTSACGSLVGSFRDGVAFFLAWAAVGATSGACAPTVATGSGAVEMVLRSTQRGPRVAPRWSRVS